MDAARALLLRPAPAPPSPQRRNQRAASRLAAPGRRCVRRLAVPDRWRPGGDDDGELPPRPRIPNIFGISSDERRRLLDRYYAEEDAYWRAVERREARAQARKAVGAQPPHAPAATPSASLAAAWPPVENSTLPAAMEARAGAAEAAAAAAVAFASAAVGHEAAGDAAYAAAAMQPASAMGAAGTEWLRASAAWRKAFESLEAAQRAAPGSEVVQEAATQVEAARRLKRQLHGISSGAAEDVQ